MTLTELRYIVILAQEKHFGRAAKRCHVSQPSLSIAINKLEAQLKTTLFERGKHTLRVTDAGKKIIAQAQVVLEEAEKITQIAQGEKGELRTPLKIGAIHTVAPYLFPKLVPKITKLAPDMPLILQEDFTSHLLEKLHQGELDMIFIATTFKDSGLVSKALYDEPFVLLLPKEHPLNQKKQVSLQDIEKEKLLLLEKGHCFRDAIVEVCPHCYSAGNSETMHAASLETLRHMVLAGMGITNLPTSAASITHYNRTLSIKSFKEKTPKRTISLVWRQSFPRQQAINVILTAIQACQLNGICLI